MSRAYSNAPYSNGGPGVGQLIGQRFGSLFGGGGQLQRQAIVATILVVALFAFEIFNFDTTEYALLNLLGDVNFSGLAWATILAVAFCAIDFAGLIRIFTPEQGRDEPKEVWYLMGAWLLGATMNALMTWWAVSLTLLNHEFGNEVLSREQLLKIVPIFVAVLVWLTRILFIGSLTVTGERIMAQRQGSGHARARGRGADTAVAAPSRGNGRSTSAARRGNGQATVVRQPATSQPAAEPAAAPANGGARNGPVRERSSRIRQRPPMPRANGGRRPMPVSNNVRASGWNDQS